MGLPVRRAAAGADGSSTSGWDPLVELDHLNRQLAGYLDLWRTNTTLLDGLFTPPADIEELDDAYLVDIELPGVAKQDLDIEIAGRRLTVRGERKEKKPVGIIRRRERAVGNFQYEVTLPGNVDEDGVGANLDHGVLTVRVPKPASERPCRIEVH